MRIQQGEPIVKREVILQGIPASPGIIVGPAFLFQQPVWEFDPQDIPAREVEAHVARFRASVAEVHADISRIHQTTRTQYGEELAEVLAIQIAFLEDEVFLKEVEEMIARDCFDAVYSTFVVFRQKKEHFLQMRNEYFRDRAFDIHSLKKMIITKLRGEEHAIRLESPAIVIAQDLSPTDTVELHRQKVMGLATDSGGKMSHTAIVARSLSVPAIVGLKRISNLIHSDDLMILDGNSGKVIINPAEETVHKYEAMHRAWAETEAVLLRDSALPTETADNKRILIRANIEFESELESVQLVNADGIGLFRTEGLFLNRRDLLSEDEQAAVYKAVADRMYPEKVVVRTLDVGGDKIVQGISVGVKEENPFLGWRAIRFWLDHEAGFLSQLKAILRANERGNVQVLFPMVSGLGEVRRLKTLVKKAANELKADGIAHNESIDIGIMIEIPSVIMIADALAQEVDFFSVGTNDLVQYALAVDRGNENVAALYSHFHPSIIRMLTIAVDAARGANIPIGMCGEMAGDPRAVPLLLALGFQELSASHAIIPEIKKVIRGVSLTECRDLLDTIKGISTTSEVVAEVDTFFEARFPGLVHGDKGLETSASR